VSGITETGGGCTGCGPNEYPSADRATCLPCPANTGNAGGAVGIWQCSANAGYYAKYTKTVQLVVELPEEDSDPETIQAYLRSAAGGGDDVVVKLDL
jgi:hypothetical protein